MADRCQNELVLAWRPGFRPRDRDLAGLGSGQFPSRQTIRPLVPVNATALLGSDGLILPLLRSMFGCRRGRYACVRPLSE